MLIYDSFSTEKKEKNKIKNAQKFNFSHNFTVFLHF